MSGPSARQLDALYRTVFSTVLLLIPILAVYAPKGFVPVLAIAALVFLTDKPVFRGLIQGIRRARFYILIGLCVLGAFLLISYQPARSLKVGLSLSALLLASYVFFLYAQAEIQKNHRRYLKILGLDLIVILVLIGLENSFRFLIPIIKEGRYIGENDYITYFSSSGSVALIFLACFWATVAIAENRRSRLGLTIGVSLIVIAICYLSRTEMNFLGSLFVVLFGAAFMILRRKIVWVLAILAIAVSAATPLAFANKDSLSVWPAEFIRIGKARYTNPIAIFNSKVFPVSVRHRVGIWSFVGTKIVERPYLGWGLDSSRSIPGGGDVGPAGLPENLPLHPHNWSMQITLEFGFVGLIGLLALFAVGLARLLKAMADPPLFLVSVTVVSIGVAGYFSFGLWQTWLWAAAGLSISLVLAFCQNSKVLDGIAISEKSRPTLETDSNSAT